MNPARFAIYSGIVWACGTLLLILISIAQGDPASWVELDFRPLTGTILIASDALGLGSYFERIISYAENGMPLTPLHIVISLPLGFADGFVSGLLLALIYKLIQGKKASSRLSVITFGVAAGIVLGLCSGILGVVSTVYGINLETFDFSIRPVFIVFYYMPGLSPEGILHSLKSSYMLLPHSYAGALAWTLWGFLDGFIGGAIGAFIYTKIKGV